MVSLRDLFWFLLSFLALAAGLLPGLAQAQPWTSMAPGTWYEYPSSTPNSVKQAANTYPDWNGSSSAYYDQCESGPTSGGGYATIFSAWSGGAYDPTNKKLWVWGGGHGDYCGNEVLSFNLLTGAWARETNRWLYVDQGTPGANPPYTDSKWEQPFGVYGNAANDAPVLTQPRSTHTYNVLQWLPVKNGFCSFGLPSTSHGSAVTPASHLIFCFDQTSKTWAGNGSIDANESLFSTMRDGQSSTDLRDPAVTWVHSSTYGAALYKCVAGAGTAMNCVRKTPYNDLYPYQTMVMDGSGRLWAVGGDNTYYSTRMGTFDLTNNQQADLGPVTTTGGVAIQSARAPGLAYLPTANRLVAWAGGADIWVFDPDTRVWTQRAPASGNTVTPPAQTATGTYGRFRCDESIGICVVVNQAHQPVHLYRLPTDLANPPSHTLSLSNSGPVTVPLSTAQNTGVSVTVTATATGTPLQVSFSAPSAGNPTFTPATCTPSGSPATCSVTFAYPANPGAAPGTYQVVVTGSDSFPTTAQTTVTYTVQAAPTSFGNIAALQHAGPATPHQLSVILPFTGTVPSTVGATVRYRQAGATSWTTGHPLSRVRPELAQNPGAAGAVTPGFSWPIIDLNPGTSYEVEVTLTDSNGGATEVRTATFTTRALPEATGAPNKFATPGMNGAALRALVSTLQPGDVLELPAGIYDITDSRWQIDANGTESQPIVIRGASKTGTIVRNSNGEIMVYLVYGNHLRFENFTLQGLAGDSGTNGGNAAFFGWSNARPQNIVIRDMNIVGVDKCLIGTAMDRVMFYNNVCYGNNQWNADFLIPSATYPNGNRTWNDDATNMPGTGNVSFNNTYEGFGDCASFAFGGHADVQNIGIYFYKNKYRKCGDDLVEVDHLYGPGGFYDNEAYNVMTCISIDPLYGGPFLYARNICVNPGRQVYKLTDGNSNYAIYNNTIISTDKYQTLQAGILSFYAFMDPNNFTAGNPQANWSMRNNIFLSCAGAQRPLYWETGFWPDQSDGIPRVDWTHNSWGLGADTRFTVQPNTWADLATAQANVPDTKGYFTNATKRFTNDTVLACQPFTDTVTLGADFLTEVTATYNLSVKNGETAKNSGVVIANITDGYSGVAPDRGAIIAGRAAVTYGCCTGGGSPPGIPATPTNLRTTQAATPTLAQIAWDFTSVPANLEQGFRVYRKLAAAGSYGAAIATVAAGTLTYSDNTVAANTAYHYAVASYNGSGESAKTSNLAVTTPSAGGGELTGAVPILNYRPWYGVSTPDSSPGIEQAVLAKGQFQALAPSFCTAGRHTLSCTQTQTAMDREMQIAAAAGIKAFAFSWFANRSANLGPGGEGALQTSYTLFNSSARTDIKQVLIMQPGYLGATDFGASTTNWHANVDAVAAIMQQANYQKVLTNKPILFLYYYAPDITTYFNNSLANLGTAITYLRSQLPNDGYVVLMMPGASAATLHSTKGTIGADAISDYYVQLAPTSKAASKTYATQDAAVQARWAALAATGSSIVPPLQFIGGPRPNVRTPSRFTPSFFQRMGEALYWLKGTPAQLAAGQVTAVGTYMAGNASVVPAKAIWIYSAYDSSEGGYPVLPSLGDPPLTQPPYTAGANAGLTNLLNVIGPVLYSYR